MINARTGDHRSGVPVLGRGSVRWLGYRRAIYAGSVRNAIELTLDSNKLREGALTLRLKFGNRTNASCSRWTL